MESKPITTGPGRHIELHVVPNPAGHVLLVGLLDNLGKGAAGAATQNLNLLLGVREDTGLHA